LQHIAGDAQGAPTQGLNFGRYILDLLGAAGRGDDIGASAGQAQSDGITQSGCSTDYDCHSAAQIEEILLHE